MFGLPMPETPYERKRREAYEQERLRARLGEGFRDWDPARTTFYPELNLRASTYNPPSLFEVEPTPTSRVNQTAMHPEQFVTSPCGQWLYREIVLAAGHKLATFSGRDRGDVMFDGDVLLPAIHGKAHRKSALTWETDPWMSLSPMEIMSLRTGTRRAKGVVVLTGLGMGHQLVEVCKRRKVTRVILVEIDQGIVDWILPRLDLHGKEVEVIVGDAEEVVPTLTADVALLDHFSGWGCNNIDRDEIARNTRRHPDGDIGFFWAWGGR